VDVYSRWSFSLARSGGKKGKGVRRKNQTMVVTWETIRRLQCTTNSSDPHTYFGGLGGVGGKSQRGADSKKNVTETEIADVKK